MYLPTSKLNHNMKNKKKCHNVKTVPKFNNKFEERSKMDTPTNDANFPGLVQELTLKMAGLN
jgi:hypothetical protein